CHIGRTLRAHLQSLNNDGLFTMFDRRNPKSVIVRNRVNVASQRDALTVEWSAMGAAKKKTSAMDGEAYLANTIARYPPAVTAIARAGLTKMRAWYPNARILVYDRRQSLPFGFAPEERGAIFSIVLYPRWVRFFFLEGVAIEDPEKRLKGS